MGASLRATEQSALVILDSQSSRASAHYRDQRKTALEVSEPAEEQFPRLRPFSKNEQKSKPRAAPCTLPQQVIYHFAVGRAVHDPRLEA